MKFLADVNIAQLIIKFLRDSSFDVLDAKQNLLLESDIKIIRIAQLENRIILTRDKDFTALVKIPKYQIPTIIFRVSNQKPENIKMYLEKLLEDTEEKILSKSLITIKDDNTEFLPLTNFTPKP